MHHHAAASTYRANFPMTQPFATIDCGVSRATAAHPRAEEKGSNSDFGENRHLKLHKRKCDHWVKTVLLESA